MPAIQLEALTCKDRTKEAGPYGGYVSWDLLMQAMERQRKLPVEERIRPCLKHNDWWIMQVPWCQKCEKAIWHIAVNGEKSTAKAVSIKGKVVELAVVDTGEVIKFVIGKGFEELGGA